MRHMKWFQKIKKTEWELYWRAWLQQNTKSQPALVLGRTLPISNFLYFASRPLIKVFRLMSRDRGSSPRWPLGLVNFATSSLLQGIQRILQNGWAGGWWNFTLHIVYRKVSKTIRITNSDCEAEEMEDDEHCSLFTEHDPYNGDKTKV